jgi:hypothetical protein
MAAQVRSAMVTRIKAQVAEFADVRGTVNITAVLRQGFRTPACFVYRLNTRREDSAECIKQFTTRYGVLIVCRIDRDDASVDDSAERLSEAVSAALDCADWMPDTRARMRHTGGNADPDLERNLLFWADYLEVKEFV